MIFCNRDFVGKVIGGKTIAIVGSGPGSIKNPVGLVDSHDLVVRVNNYRLFPGTGYRTDIYYSFFGHSVRKTSGQLKRDGVRLCMCKCPNEKFIDSDWHDKNKKTNGVDFTSIYETRKGWWFCPTYIPSHDEFMQHFHLLGGHVPTTGFAGLLDILSFEPAHVYMTGFDFFRSGRHNVTERWSKVNGDDPIGHVPETERQWLLDNIGRYPITVDNALENCLNDL